MKLEVNTWSVGQNADDYVVHVEKTSLYKYLIFWTYELLDFHHWLCGAGLPEWIPEFILVGLYRISTKVFNYTWATTIQELNITKEEALALGWEDWDDDNCN